MDNGEVRPRKMYRRNRTLCLEMRGNAATVLENRDPFLSVNASPNSTRRGLDPLSLFGAYWCLFFSKLF